MTYGKRELAASNYSEMNKLAHSPVSMLLLFVRRILEFIKLYPYQFGFFFFISYSYSSYLMKQVYSSPAVSQPRPSNSDSGHTAGSFDLNKLGIVNGKSNNINNHNVHHRKSSKNKRRMRKKVKWSDELGNELHRVKLFSMDENESNEAKQDGEEEKGDIDIEKDGHENNVESININKSNEGNEMRGSDENIAVNYKMTRVSSIVLLKNHLDQFHYQQHYQQQPKQKQTTTKPNENSEKKSENVKANDQERPDVDKSEKPVGNDVHSETIVDNPDKESKEQAMVGLHVSPLENPHKLNSGNNNSQDANNNNNSSSSSNRERKDDTPNDDFGWFAASDSEMVEKEEDEEE